VPAALIAAQALDGLTRVEQLLAPFERIDFIDDRFQTLEIGTQFRLLRLQLSYGLPSMIQTVPARSTPSRGWRRHVQLLAQQVVFELADGR
jgi:hypothetical protein